MPEQPGTARHVPGRLLLLATASALIILVALGTLFVGYASTGSEPVAQPLVLSLFGQPTALPPTPTKTPSAPETSTPTATPTAPLPTNTPGAGATPEPQRLVPTATAQPTVSPQTAALLRGYGYDPAGRFIVINQNLQQMIVGDNGTLHMFPVSSGDPDKLWRTPAWHGLVGDYWGTFSSFGVYADHGWYLFQAGGAILIHGAPYTFDDQGNKVYEQTDAIGLYPASRGCIRMKPQDIEWFSDWNPRGVPMVILPYDGGSAREG